MLLWKQKKTHGQKLKEKFEPPKRESEPERPVRTVRLGNLEHPSTSLILDTLDQ